MRDTNTIILVVIDCLRADHCSMCGYPRPTTPTLDRWASQGVLWEQAHTTSSWTRPAVTSMLTGLYPVQHGVYEGIKRSGSDGPTTTDSYRSTHATLAERLGRHGWRCGAFLDNAQLAPFCGLHLGFDVYRWDIHEADNILAALTEWLHAESDRPAFAYLHLLEAHWPYKPRRRHVVLLGGDRDQNLFRDYTARDYARLRRAVEKGTASLSPEQLDHMVLMYDGAIRRLDGKLKVLEQRLEDLGRLDTAALFVTADHGDELLEHGRIGHGHALYEELTHVPLVARLPGGPQGLRIAHPVSLVDLLDTILHVAGVPDADVQGRLIGPAERARPVAAELRNQQRYRQTIHVGSWKLHRRYKFPRDADDQVPRRLMHTVHLPDYFVRDELYDLSQDPREQENRMTSRRATAVHAGLEAAVTAWWNEAIASHRPGADAEIEVDQTVIQRLRDLGYVE